MYFRLGVLPALALLSMGVHGEGVPERDARNYDQPHTRYHYKPFPVTTREDWEHRRARLRQQILTAAGLDPMPARTPLNARIFGKQVLGDVTVEKVLLETRPGFFLGGNLYRPVKPGGNRPGVLTPHGHWKLGRLENTDVNSGPALAYGFARMGFVAFAYDMLEYNDTPQLPHKFGDDDSSQLWAFHAFGMQTWNSIRALDFLESLPGVDRKRLAVTGPSGGGTQTFVLGAIDDRVAVSAPVNMVSAHFQGGCECENAPGLRVGTNNVEIAAMMAPRPQLLVAATGDWTKNVPKEEFPQIQRVYRLYGKEGLVETVRMDAEHNYNKDSRQAVYRFFARHLLKDETCEACLEDQLKISDVMTLRALRDGERVPGALPQEALFGAWKAETVTAAQTASRGELRQRMQRALGVEWPVQVLDEVKGEEVVLSTPERHERIRGIWLKKPGKRALLVVHEEGAKDGKHWFEGHAADEKESAVLYLDPYQAGRSLDLREMAGLNHRLCFQRTADMNRVQDVMTAMVWLRQQGYRELRVAGVKDGALWAFFAVAVSRSPVELYADLRGFDGSEKAFVRKFFVPGVMRAGGYAAALRLVKEWGKTWKQAPAVPAGPTAVE